MINQATQNDVQPSSTSKGATQALAIWVAQTTYDQLPDKAISRLRDFFLDWTGIAAFASGHAESSADIRVAVKRLDPEVGPATVVGEKRGFSWLYAALLNGCHAHSLDFDDTNRIQHGHPSAPVFAALFADSERLDTSGRVFFEAAAVGYEIACRVGAALGPGCWKRGFHMTSVAGIFGAVAAVAKIRKFDSHTIENAWGLALSKAAGSMQYLENGAFNKRLHPGFAAHDALQCAALAEAGLKGASSAFEGERGLLVAYTEEPRPAFLLDRLGENWLLLDTAIKPYPSCRLTHGSIDAAIKLRDSVPVEDRAKANLTVEISSTAYDIVGETSPDKITPKNTVDAQFSVYFQVAAAFLDGQVNWKSYDRITAPDLVQLTKRVTVKKNDDVPDGGGIVTVEVDGKKDTERVNVPLGEPENWIGAAKLREKFMLLSSQTYGNELAARIADRIMAFDAEDSVRSIIKLLPLQSGE
ncbi:MAG: MmgE/PrpD family protein [Brasilonema angustatum HA4187-MV1]|jgi:2-methylcitrate dehydratase PrpD|nr:MmgE/PrpD family protein [Brasilonema angustatum HA4187-MV1]